MSAPPETSPADEGRVADAAPGNWIDRHAPAALRPYLRLARFDRPIGFWLLALPCWWSVVLGAEATGAPWPDPWLLALFTIGAVAMRGAGCTLNDIIDRDLDAGVARTRSRPLPSGQVSLNGALIFLALQCLVGLAVLIALNPFTIALGFASVALVAFYPFAKRLTNWPQIVLGLTINWGALMGYAAVTGGLSPAPVLLYAGALFWTIGYDTIYAHQDREDDALMGIGSSALALGHRTPVWLTLFYGLAAALILTAGFLAGFGWGFFVMMLAPLAHLIWQVREIEVDRPALCLKLFKSNREFGILVIVAMLAGLWT